MIRATIVRTAAMILTGLVALQSSASGHPGDGCACQRQAVVHVPHIAPMAQAFHAGCGCGAAAAACCSPGGFGYVGAIHGIYSDSAGLHGGSAPGGFLSGYEGLPNMDGGGIHHRYPYHSYRRPWAHPGPPSTNITIVW